MIDWYTLGLLWSYFFTGVAIALLMSLVLPPIIINIFFGVIGVSACVYAMYKH